MTYKTHQKDAVTALLRSADRHLTADEIAQLLKESGTPVGLTTVYRTLTALVESGEVKKFTHEGSACYQYGDCGCKSHLHFKCAECGRLFHVDCDILDSLEEHVKSEHNFILDSSKTVFYGRCEDCAGKGEK